jgi:DNA repair exonuclease SbcCD ATPase subunit
MRFAALEIHGFRGIKDTLSLRIPKGFLVISGGNGAGKSTLCDAIEFALRGSIERTKDAVEAGERIDDYMWWRGDGGKDHGYVRLTIEDTEGQEHVIERRRDGLVNMEQSEIKRLLCDVQQSPSNAMFQLCRSAIIKDEEINRLSIELKETERFDFVRSAIWESGSPVFLNIAKAVGDSCEERMKRLQVNLEQESKEIDRLLQTASGLRAEIKGQESSHEADARLRKLLNSPLDSRKELLQAARSRLDLLYQELEGLERIANELEKRDKTGAFFRTREYQQELDDLGRKRNELAATMSATADELETVEDRLQEYHESERKDSLLAQLLEHGGTLGLLDGSCPLCGSDVSKDAFSSHLQEIDEYVSGRAAELKELVKNQAILKKEQSKNGLRLRNIETELDSLSYGPAQVQEETKKLLQEAEQYGAVISDSRARAPRALETQITNRKSALADLRTAIRSLEASRSGERLQGLEKSLEVAKSQRKATEEALGRVRKLKQDAQDITSALREIEIEVIRERLASISPLLKELYSIMRPHPTWEELEYRIRGQVHGYLSLIVGGSHNPRFLYSSGQRRTVGLAFLLAVHLSTKWTRLESTVLDDPIQHIDDYRALHLVELLSGVRRAGRQVICTTEDPTLAEFLGRRLGVTTNEMGSLVELEYLKDQGVRVKAERPVLPLEQRILLSA